MKRDMFEKIHRINNRISETDMLYHQFATAIGVPDSVMRVMYTLHDHGGESCLLSDVYKQTDISKQTVNSAIRKLEKDGILYLELYKGKAKKVILTEKGKKFLQQTAVRLYDAELRAYSSWTDEEMNMYILLIEKYLNCLRSEMEKE